MTTIVGDIAYEVALDTSKMIAGQREVDRAVSKVDASLTAVSKATKTHVAALELQSAVSQKVAQAMSNAAAANESFGAASGVAASAASKLGGAVALLPAPLLAVGAVVGALLVGFFKGRAEMREFEQALIMTGNASGVTSDQLSKMALRLDSLANITRTQAAQALTAFVQAGVQGGNALDKYAEAAIRLQQAGGPAVEETARAFVALQHNPLLAVERLNQATNFLTADLVRQIGSLERQGQVIEAARLAQSAYADAIIQRNPQVVANLGTVERAARAVASVAKEMWDALLNVGREKTVDERIDQIRKQIENLEKQATTKPRRGGTVRELSAVDPEDRKAAIETLKEELRLLERARSAAGGLADADAKRAQEARDALEQEKKRRSAGAGFDAIAYLVGLQERTAEAYDKIDLIEGEELRKNDERLKKKEISTAVHEEARLLIIEAAAKTRVDLYNKEVQAAENRDEQLQRLIDEKEKQAANKRVRGQEFARDVVGGTDEMTKLQVELEKKSALLAEYAEHDQANLQLYAEARVELERQTSEKMREIRERDATQREQLNSQVLSSYGSLFSDLLGVLRNAGKEQTALGKALFLAERAIAVAQIIANTEVGAAKAIGLAGPFGIPLATFIRASGYASAGLVAGLAIGQVAGGRQYGGPVSSGSLYRINESGRPEMFTAANGAQYMLPTQSGSVTPAGGGGATLLEVRVINQVPNVSVTQRTGNDGKPELVIAEVARQIRENDGPVWSAMRGATNVQGRLS